MKIPSLARLFQRHRGSAATTPKHATVSHHQARQQKNTQQKFIETNDDFWQVDEAAILHHSEGLIYELSMDLFFNATHFVVIEDQLGPPHTHSYRLQVRCHSQALSMQDQVVVTYKELRDRVRQVTAAYNNQTLNELPPFQNMQTTTENLAAVIHQQLTRLVSDLPVELTQITIWESPTEAITIRKT